MRVARTAVRRGSFRFGRLRELGRTCHTIESDAFSRAGCEQILAAALDSAGQVDILISNPAYSQRCGFLDYPAETFDKTIAGTLTAGFHMSQLVARHMVERGQGGKIVFISSVQAEMPIGLCVAYGAAKAGLNHMMRTIAVELSPHRINVNAIEPGTRCSLETDVFPSLVGRDLFAYSHAQSLIDIGTPDSYSYAQTYLPLLAGFGQTPKD